MTTDIPKHVHFGGKDRFPPSDDDLSNVSLIRQVKKNPLHEKINALLHKIFYREKDRFEWK